MILTRAFYNELLNDTIDSMRTHKEFSEEYLHCDLADRLLPGLVTSRAKILSEWKTRKLPNGAMVTRVAPSPTGAMHIGTVYMALLCKRFAEQTSGVFFLRIEDTDKKREVEGAAKIITDTLTRLGITIDEGVVNDGSQKGDYGPYIQSERNYLYHAFVHDLIARGLAYPCFASPLELEKIHYEQETAGVRFGYYGEYAVWKSKTKDEVDTMLLAGEPFVIRLHSMGNIEKRVSFNDMIKGEVSFPENDHDIVLLKSDMTPTYHLAHAVDDYLMGTTHVIRGDEWLSSIPTHIQLHEALGFDIPYYAHCAPINKFDGGNKRKLSKRKDPEANMQFFFEKGYPFNGLLNYLMNLASSDYEGWAMKDIANNTWNKFPLTWEKLKESTGPIFNEVKLQDMCKEYLSHITAERFYEEIMDWANNCHEGCKVVLSFDKPFWIKVFNMERNPDKPRKDIACFSDVPMNYMYMNRMMFLDYRWHEQKFLLSRSEQIEFLKEFKTKCNPESTKEQWFTMMQDMAEERGFARDIKSMKAESTKYRGHVGDVVSVLRYALAARLQTADLHAVMQVLDPSECKKRIDASLVILEESSFKILIKKIRGFLGELKTKITGK